MSPTIVPALWDLRCASMWAEPVGAAGEVAPVRVVLSFCESDAYGPSAIPASPGAVFLGAGVAAQAGEEGLAADHREHRVVVS